MSAKNLNPLHEQSPNGSLNAALAIGEQGDVGLMFEAGALSEDPVCVMFRQASLKLDVVLASGEIIHMGEPVRPDLLSAVEKAQRILLVEVKDGHAISGRSVPLFHQGEKKVAQPAVA